MDRAFPPNVDDGSERAEDSDESGGRSGGVASRLRRLVGRIFGVADDSGGSARDGNRTGTDPGAGRRGACARCGRGFDADEGYAVLDVLERDADDPRRGSSERTVRLCTDCTSEFRAFVNLEDPVGDGEDGDGVPRFLR